MKYTYNSTIFIIQKFGYKNSIIYHWVENKIYIAYWLHVG